MKMKLIFFYSLILFSLNFLLCCNEPKKEDKNELVVDSSHILASVTPTPTPTVPDKTADKSLLMGIWERTDAPYQIKITEVMEDNNLKAGYFNPKSINVSKAMWNNENGLLKMYIELRDENYPGSNYKLNYNIEQDALMGEYFQAVEGNTYNVAFRRMK